MTQEQMHQNIIEGLKRAAPIAEKHEVMLILEPMNIRVDHKGHCLYGSEPTLRILKAVGSRNIKMLADLYHLTVNGDDVVRVVTEHADQIGHVQVADAPGRHEPGSGNIPIVKLVDALERHGYTGAIRAFSPRLARIISVSRQASRSFSRFSGSSGCSPGFSMVIAAVRK